MADNLNLELRLTGNTSGLTSALNSARGHVNQFGTNAVNVFGRIGASASRAYQQLNGFSGLTKLAALAGGTTLLNDALQRNLEFEKSLLDMKQTAQMTTAQALEMRRLAISAASNNMALPSEVAAGLKAFSAAGMKFDSIAPSIEESARAAVAFRATVEDIAKLDFDLQDKLKINPEQVKNVHNMLLYHAKSGRFEAGPMATEAPKYLNSAASVGITGVQGLNFTGAMTQVLMKLAPATQPAEVSTFMEHGLGHITAGHLTKKLAAFNIDVQKFMPKGKFYGEGGVQGILDLAAAMKAKGLDDPFKMDKAGFREMYTKKFWKQLMAYQGDIQEAMREGNKAALDDMVGRDKAEIMASNYGKVKAAQIAREKGMLGDGASKGVDLYASVMQAAADNPGAAAAVAGGLAVGGRLLWKKITGAGGAAAGDLAGAALGAGGVQKVFVTNPGFGSDKPIFKKAVESGGGAAAGAAAGAASMGALATAGATAALLAVTGAPILAAGMALSERANSKDGLTGRVADRNARLNELAELSRLEKANGAAPAALARLDQQMTAMVADRNALLQKLEALAARPVQVVLDGQVLAESVNNINGRDGRRGR